MAEISPHLWVQDMARSIAFYTDVMRFTVRRADPADAPTHASLARDGTNIMLAAYGESFEGWPMAAEAVRRHGTAGAVSFYIEAGDIQAEYQKAVAAGAVIPDPLGARPWGQHEFTVADPDGFWWAVWKAE